MSDIATRILVTDAAVRARQARLESDLRAEGMAESDVQRLATKQVAHTMVENEAYLVGKILEIMGGSI